MGKKARGRAARASQSNLSNSDISSPDRNPPVGLTNACDLGNFLSRCEQYRAKISDFEVVSQSLYELLKEGTPFQWEQCHDIAYEHLVSAVGRLALTSEDIASQGDIVTPNFSTPKPQTHDKEVVEVLENLTKAIQDMNVAKNNSPKNMPSLRRYDSSSESENDNDDSLVSTPKLMARKVSNHHIRLPPFNGSSKESWKVWYNRFEEVAERQGWSEAMRLDEMLPKLQGIAGDYVFGQLSKKSRSSYRILVKELETRFRVIENPKAYALKFSRRDQRQGESVEEYAAALKEIYDKAHPNRDESTRGEDLLRRFLDGLLDEKAKSQVEFVKSPSSIDEAMYEVVNFCEAQGKVYKRAARMVRPYDSDEESDDENKVNRVFTKSEKKGDQNDILSKVDQLTKKLEEISEKVDGSHKKRPYRKDLKDVECFYCKQKGHVRKFCRKLKQDMADSNLNVNAKPYVPEQDIPTPHSSEAAQSHPMSAESLN